MNLCRCAAQNVFHRIAGCSYLMVSRKSSGKQSAVSFEPAADFPASSHDSGSPPPPGVPFFGGGIGPSVGANWPPSRRREETDALKNLERKVGAFKLNSSHHLLGSRPDTNRLQDEKTEPDVPDNRPSLLRKVRV